MQRERAALRSNSRHWMAELNAGIFIKEGNENLTIYFMYFCIIKANIRDRKPICLYKIIHNNFIPSWISIHYQSI